MHIYFFDQKSTFCLKKNLLQMQNPLSNSFCAFSPCLSIISFVCFTLQLWICKSRAKHTQAHWNETGVPKISEQRRAATTNYAHWSVFVLYSSSIYITRTLDYNKKIWINNSKTILQPKIVLCFIFVFIRGFYFFLFIFHRSPVSSFRHGTNVTNFWELFSSCASLWAKHLHTNDAHFHELCPNCSDPVRDWEKLSSWRFIEICKWTTGFKLFFWIKNANDG